jgi:hypothetical protein
VESGVVYTKWGTISLGAVLAGLAAGLYQEDVQLPALVQNTQSPRNLPRELESVTVDNRFAATLVGKDSSQFVDGTLIYFTAAKYNIKWYND